MRLYICYAYADRHIIKQLVDVVREADFEPLYEQALLEDSIWYEQLEDTIATSDGFMFVLSSKSLTDDWCRWELNTAIELSKPIIPALIQTDVPLPIAFARHPYADFTDRTLPGIERFQQALAALRIIIPRDEAPPPPGQPAGLPSHAMTAHANADPAKTVPSAATMAQSFYDRARLRPAHEVDEKIADYTEAIKIDPTYAEAYARRGANRSAKRDYDGALDDYNRAIELDTSLAYAYFNRGMAHEDRKNSEAALSDYANAIRLNSDYADAYNNRGNLRYIQGDYDGAISDYEAIIRIHPKQPNAYYNRGNAREKLGDVRGAIDDWSRYLHLGGGNESADPDRVERRIRELKKKLRGQ